MVVQDTWLSSEAAGEAEFLDELQPGTKLMHGQYTIREFLNSGGFGITYLAADSLDRTVVIKECFPGSFCRRSNASVRPRSRAHQAELRSIVRLFAQEARSLSKVGHPNIVGVHNVFEDNNTAYMALDFVKGRDMLELIEDEEIILTPGQVTGYLEKLLVAIGFVHQTGLLHRDISPDNIIIREDGEPVLIDFGAAREQASKASRVLSALRVVKDGYSPQEFYISGSEQSPSCDLYSLAASFYHIITGVLPPDSQKRLSAYAAGDKDPYVSLSERTMDYDPRFCAALDKAMSVLPRERVQSAEEWLMLMKGEPVRAAPVTPRKPAVADRNTARSPRQAASSGQKPAGKIAPLLLGTTGLVAAAGAGLIFFGNGAEQSLAIEPAAIVAAAPAVQDQAPVTNAASDENPAAPLVEAVAADVPKIAPVTPLPEISDIAVADEVALAEISAPAAAESLVASATVPALDNLPEGVELVAPAQEPAPVPEMTLDTLPEGVELVVPEQEPAALPQSEMTAANLPEGVELMAPAAAPEPAAVVPAIVENPVFLASMWSVQLPFTPGSGDPRTVGEVTASMYPWLEPGMVVEMINDMDVMSIDSIPAMMRQSVEVGDMSYIEVTMALRSPAAAEAIERSVMLPVTQIVALKNDVRFMTIFDGGDWVTRVQEIPNSEMTTLQVNDVVVGLTETGKVFENRMDFTLMVEELRRAGANEVVFDVLRDGAPTTASVTFEAVAEVAASEPAAEVTASLDTAPASAFTAATPLDASPVMSDVRVDLPFATDPSQPGILSRVAADAPFWMADGLRVISVNDQAITSLAEIEPLVMDGLAPDATTAAIEFGIAGRLNNFVTVRTLNVPVVHETYLLNGLGFRAKFDGAAWITTVIAAPDGSELAVGDIVKAHVTTNQLIDGPDQLRSLIENDLAAGSNSFTFAVERNGSIWVKSFALSSL